MLLISVFIKKLMKKKKKISKNSTSILDVLFHRLTSSSTLIQMLLPAHINIILKLFFIYYNSVVLFPNKKSVQLSSCIYEKFFFTAKTMKSFSSQQKQCNVNYSHTRALCLLFICTLAVERIRTILFKFLEKT